MLSIDEAIAHAREVANTQRGKSGICLQNGLECEHFSDCLKCAEEHEQLAEWLEELKAFKENKWTDIYIKRGYNKAIDDCKELTFREVVYCDSLNDRTEFRELAEQLKGKYNE